MGEAVRLHLVAQKCLGSLGGNKPTRLVLSLFFKAVVGIQRVFHFETLSDSGFAILSGGRKVLGRNMLGGLIRAAPVRGVLRLAHLTEPKIKRTKILRVSIDEHVIPRFTRKFDIRKGFHTIRNKKMKVEKLFFSYGVGARQLLSLWATRGHVKLVTASEKLLSRLRPRAAGACIRVILDAGAADNHGRLLSLVDRPRQVTLVRTPRRPAYRRHWESLPGRCWTRVEEPGPHQAAPKKIIHIAETRTTLKDRSRGGGGRSVSARTIVIREQARKGKLRWHAIWVFGDDKTSALKVLEEFRTRQHHEQTYRVMLHDLFVDTAACGYNKQSVNPTRPGFKQNAITLCGWIAAVANNSLDALTKMVAPHLDVHAHPRTLRRWLINVPADIYLGMGTLIVHLKPAKLHNLWVVLARTANARAVRIPWMENRRLILALERPNRPRQAEPSADPRDAKGGIWC